MNQEDIQFMKRALDLARLGAGLVSPNPMVGAVLVKGGLIIGVGYHRYDRLKHAEAYAIEMAGEAARGATLYCTLEPCCHHARTPPCADALIESGIMRAVIAVRDQNPLVNGRGLEQLRAAGIEVETGACEEEATRLNECYSKFISGGGPFVHGVIEYPASIEGPVDLWTPSPEFLEVASECDSIVLGSRPDINRMLIEARLKRVRHRPFVVVGYESTSEKYSYPPRAADEERVSLVNAAIRPGPRVEEARLVDSTGLGETPPQPDLDLTLEMLGQMKVISVLVLPGIFDFGNRRDFERLDKLTLALPGAEGAMGTRGVEVSTSRLTYGTLEFDLEEVSFGEAGGYAEFTGYPRLRGTG